MIIWGSAVTSLLAVSSVNLLDSFEYSPKSFSILCALDLVLAIDHKMWYPGYQARSRHVDLFIHFFATCVASKPFINLRFFQAGIQTSLFQDLQIRDILLLFEIPLEELLHYPILQLGAAGLPCHCNQSMTVTRVARFPSVFEFDSNLGAFTGKSLLDGGSALSAELGLIHGLLVGTGFGRVRIQVKRMPRNIEVIVRGGLCGIVGFDPGFEFVLANVAPRADGIRGHSDGEIGHSSDGGAERHCD